MALRCILRLLLSAPLPFRRTILQVLISLDQLSVLALRATRVDTVPREAKVQDTERS